MVLVQSEGRLELIMMTIEKILKVEPSPVERLRRKRSRIFLWNTDKSIIEMVTHRFERDLDQYAEMIPEAVELAGLTGASEYTYFSRACTCGASPGFLADAWLKDERDVPYDIHITYTQKVTSATSFAAVAAGLASS